MRHVEGRHAAGDREGGAGKEGEVEPFGIFHHFHALLPVGGEVLVIEYGDAAPGGLEDLHALLEPVVSWVEFLAFLITGIVTVLRDDDHAVNGEFAAAQGQGVFNVRVEFEAIFLHPLSGEISFLRELVDEDGSDLEAGFLPGSTPAIAHGKAIEEVLGMGVRSDDGAEERNFFAGGRPSILRAEGGARQRSGGGEAGEKGTAIHGH